MGLQAVSQAQEEEPPAIPARRDSLGKASWLMRRLAEIAYTIIIIAIYNLSNILI